LASEVVTPKTAEPPPPDTPAFSLPPGKIVSAHPSGQRQGLPLRLQQTPGSKKSERSRKIDGGSGIPSPCSPRKRPSIGYDPAIDSVKAQAASANLSLFPDMKPEQGMRREIPLIDQIHRLMHLWKAGEVAKVDDYWIPGHYSVIILSTMFFRL